MKYHLFFLQEIDELLSGGLTAEDEEDIMNELAELERLELPSVPDTEIPTADVDDQLPDVPSTEPGKFPRFCLAIDLNSRFIFIQPENFSWYFSQISP